MKENSIEEDIILLKDFTEGNFKIDKLENYKGSYKMGYFYYKDIQQAIEHILSDYKRVLKENEEFKEYNIEYKRILGLADNRIYRKKYLEERRKEQPNLLYPDSDEIYQRYYELKQENEKLKEKESKIYKEVQESLSFEKFLIAKGGTPDLFNQGRFYISQIVYDILNNVKNPEGIHKENKYIKHIDYISIQRIKDKIEELNKLLKKYEENNMEKDEDYFFDVNAIKGEIQVLQELLEK